MSKIGVSKISIKSALFALGVIVMLIGMNVQTNVGAALENKISLSTDITTSDIMVGKGVTATLTLSNDDDDFQIMEIYMLAQFTDPTIDWSYDFYDADFVPLGKNPLISLGQGISKTLKFTVLCDSSCSAGDTAKIQIYGKTDPTWLSDTESGQGYTTELHPSNEGSGCKLAGNCVDTTTAQTSRNTTNPVDVTYTARSGAGSSLDCDEESSSGDNQMYQGTTYTWGYTLTNTGWNDDSYTFVMSISSDDAVTTDWSLSPGLSNGQQLTGQSDSSSTAVKSKDGVMSIRPVDTARPGVYTITLTVSSNASPKPDDSTCSFDVVIPAPDLEIKNTDITFSHTGAWINTRGDSQKVTIFAKVRNNGGSIDSDGVTASDISVTFNVDGSQLGQSQTISSLAHGEEYTAEIDWNPTRPHEDDEVGIPITVSVDTKGGESSISESDEDNNDGTVYFKVVRTKASSPSFYVGFVSLIAAGGVAVLLSSYYRNKEGSD